MDEKQQVAGGPRRGVGPVDRAGRLFVDPGRRRRPGRDHRQRRRRDARARAKLVIEAEGLAKSFGATPVVRDVSLRVLRGDRIGIIGPNGAGKTTLVRLLTGDLAPDRGTVRLGTNLQTVSLDQSRESLRPDWTLAQALTDGRGDTVFVGSKAKHVIGYMKDFLFAPEQAGTPLTALSGGERGRLMLARALAQPSNLLVLDEPTNDLDLETLELLQEMLADYPGTVLLVSHDRDFLDRTVTAVLAAEGDGRWVEYAGGYSDMLAQRGTRQSASAERKDKPRRQKAESSTKRAGLTFKERHVLERLPAKIEALQAEIADLEAALADPDLFSRDRTAFERTSAKLQAASANLAQAEEDWLTLEMKRESAS